MRTERPADRGDEGFSLLEVVVSMTIMSVVTAVVIGSLTQIYRAVNNIDNVTVARDALANSFRRLDKEFRYASWVNSPAAVNGVWYVEYELPPDPMDKTANGTKARCRQLAFGNGVLTLASWYPADTSTPGKANTLGANLAPISGINPFTRYGVGDKPFATATAAAAVAGVGSQYSPEHAQLRLRFNGVWGRTTLPFDLTLTAENNTANSAPESDCADGRPT